MTRERTYSQAVHEGLDVCLARDPAVYVMGLGVSDPKGVFGTTLGLAEKHGRTRVRDMPTAENGMTGIAIGSALVGMRPVLTHQRVDFALLSVEQIVNQAAKWRYMFGGQRSVPLTVRMIIGRGWGQGAQHSGSLQSWFAHVPGLKVVMPATPHDAKGLLVAAIEDDDPVIVLEHRWLHAIHGPVPDGHYAVPLGRAAVVRPGRDVSLVATSYMVLESLRAADLLAPLGIEAEVVDVRTLRPLDTVTVLESVRRTGRLVAVDTDWTTCGFAAEVLALAAEHALHDLRAPPRRVGLADCPSPSSPALAAGYWPRAADIARAVCAMTGHPAPEEPPSAVPHDVPDPTFTGPF